MAVAVSETFRQNCYDNTKKQRMVFLASDNTIFTNEDISVGSKVRFNLSSCKSQQIMFGETPCNTISLTLLNEDGRISAADVAKEYACYVGVEVSNADYVTGENTLSAVRSGAEHISVHSTAPYIRGNIKLGTTIAQLSNGYPCKIMLAYDYLYFAVKNGSTMYYGKHKRTGAFTFGNNLTPTDLEKTNLDRLMNDSKLSGISFYKNGFEEYGTKTSSTVTSTTWNTAKSGTWSDMKEGTWGEYTKTTTFKAILFESVPYGKWHFDKPRKINSAVITLNGKDRMDRFDEDCLTYISTRANRNYIMRDIITTIANYKNVDIGSIASINDFMNHDQIFKMRYMEGKSLKDLLSYALEVCAVNGMIDRDGNFTTSDNAGTAISIPYAYSFDVADSIAHTIGKVLVYKQGDYTLYQEDNTVTDGATYDWSDNPMFSSSNPEYSWFSKNIHKKYGGFHNAITVSDADYSIWCDDQYSFTQDGVTYREPIFAMTVEWDGFGKVTYTNYGEETRMYSSYDSRMNAVSSVNDVNLQGFNQAKYADKLEFSSDGLTIYSQGMKIYNHNGDEVLTADSNGNLTVEGTIKADAGYIGNWDIVDDNLKCIDANDEKNYILLGKKMGYPVMNLSESIGVSSSGTDVYEASVGATTISFKDKISPNALTVGANISYGVSSRGRSLNITGNNRSDSYGICEVRIQSTDGENSGQVSLISPNVYMSSSPVIYNPPTTTTAANTTLISTGLGYKIYRVSSLKAVKDNIKTIENPSEKVDNLRGVSFTSKCDADDPKTVMFGFIAEEVAEAVPELAAYVDGKLQSVQYDRVCALLVEDNKALHKRISDLETRLEELERRLNK